MARQRAGLVIQNIGDEAQLVEDLKRINPAHLTVISNPAFAKKLAVELPQTMVWHRYHRKDEAELSKGGQQEIDKLIGDFRKDGLDRHPNIGLYVSNEPKYVGEALKRDIAWHVKLAETVNGSFPLLLWNGGVGNYELVTLDMGFLDPLFAVSHKYPGKVWIGAHEYGGPVVWLSSAGRSELGHFDIEKARSKPSVWDVQVTGVLNRNNWLVGKVWNWIDRARLMGYDKARFIISECGPDDIPRYRATANLYERIGTEFGRFENINGQVKWSKMPYPHYEWGGWQCYRWYYEKTFAGLWTSHIHEHVILDMIQWYGFIYADYEFGFGDEWSRYPKAAAELLKKYGSKIQVRAIETDDPVIGGFLVWLQSPNKPDWDVARGGSLHRTPLVYQWWGDWTAQLEKPKPPPAPEPPPPAPPENPASNDARWQAVILLAKEAWQPIPVRARPVPTIETSEFLVSGTTVKYLPQEKWGGFCPVMLATGFIGWVMDLAVLFQQVPEPPPVPPAPGSPVMTKEEAEKWVSTNFAILESMEAETQAVYDRYKHSEVRDAIWRGHVERVARENGVEIPRKEVTHEPV